MWQLFIVLYFIFSTAAYLLRRVLAQKIGEHNRLINSIFFLVFLLPAAIILTFFFPHNLNVGWVNLVLLLGGSVVWPISNIVAFSANKKVDVGIFTIINNLSPLFTMMIALPFLHENMSVLQYLGIVLLILSGVIAASSHAMKNIRMSLEGILMCLFSAVVLGVGIAYESFMLHRVDFGAYLIYGWGAQIVWMAILTGRELRKLPKFINTNAEISKMLLIWGGMKALGSVAFILALKISGSASIISSASDFLSVSVVIAAWFFLNERKHIIYKLFASVIGIAGLLLITK